MLGLNIGKVQNYKEGGGSLAFGWYPNRPQSPVDFWLGFNVAVTDETRDHWSVQPYFKILPVNSKNPLNADANKAVLNSLTHGTLSTFSLKETFDFGKPRTVFKGKSINFFGERNLEHKQRGAVSLTLALYAVFDPGVFTHHGSKVFGFGGISGYPFIAQKAGKEDHKRDPSDGYGSFVFEQMIRVTTID